MSGHLVDSEMADITNSIDSSSPTSSDYSQYLTLVHSDSFDKDEELDKETNGTNTATQEGNEDKENEEGKVDREALTEELEKVEAEIKTLRIVLTSRQKRAAEIKKTLGHNIVTDVKEKVKHLQESEVILKTNQAFKSAGERTSAAFSNFGKRFGDVRSRIGESIGTSINNVKARVSSGNLSNSSPDKSASGTQKVSSISDEDISLYADLDDAPY